MSKLFEVLLTAVYMILFLILFIPFAILGVVLHAAFCSTNVGYGYMDTIVRGKIQQRMKEGADDARK